MSALARNLAGALALALLAIVALGASGAAAAPTVPSGFQVEPAYTGLQQPVSFRFTPAGGLFVAEKNGEIKYFAPGSNTPTLFADLRKPTYDNQDRGLLGLAVDPGFEAGRPFVYALYTYDHELAKPPGIEYPKYGEAANEYENDPCPTSAQGCVVSGRLVKLTAEAGHAAPVAAAPSEEVLLEGWCQQYLSHSIGDLAFGPEGALYVSGGDGASYETADFGQPELGNPCADPPDEGGSMRSLSVLRDDGPTLLNGALLRIDPDTGEGWEGNPFATSADPNARRIVAFGFRNPFRFALDPVSGDAYIDNVGNAEVEEIDRFPFGADAAYDSGWPCFEGSHHNWAFEPIGLPICEGLYDQAGSTSAPLFEYQHWQPIVPGDTCPSGLGSAISGVAVYNGSGYPDEYDRALFFADSVRGCIYVLPAGANGQPDPDKVTPFLSEQSGGSASLYPGVDIEPGPGGDLYYASLGTGTIYRIKYDPETPKPVLTTATENGDVPLHVTFNAGGSTGVPGHELRYEWDLDGNGGFEPASTAAVREETYVDGSHNVDAAVRVKDMVNGRTAVAKKRIYPGDVPPTVEIEAPLPGLTWNVGQPLSFRGSATAHGGASLPATDLAWDTRLLHCPFSPDDCHQHPLGIYRGTDSGQFPAPNHDYPSYVNFVLTATDSRGLSATKELKVAARPVSLNVDSSPPGISIGVGTTARTTPFQFLAIEGSPTTLTAPAEAVVSGTEYRFERWSDGGARSHVVPAASSGSYLAVYAAVAGPPGPPGPPDGGGTGSQPSGSPGSGPQPGPGPVASIKRPKLDARPAKQASSGVARFVFATPGASGYQCRIDRRQVAPCHSPRTYRQLRPGPHTFRVRAVGVGGTPISVATVYSWRVVAP
jgi:glucose/arabinose dehydrogenase